MIERDPPPTQSPRGHGDVRPDPDEPMADRDVLLLVDDGLESVSPTGTAPFPAVGIDDLVSKLEEPESRDAATTRVPTSKQKTPTSRTSAPGTSKASGSESRNGGAKPPKRRRLIRTNPKDLEVDPDYVKPSEGWGTSIAVHALILLLLWFATLHDPEERSGLPLAASFLTTETEDSLERIEDLELEQPLAPTEVLPQPEPMSIEPLTEIELTEGPSIAEPDLTESTTRVEAPQIEGFGETQFGRPTENINGVEVRVGDPQFTLIWDEEVDLDLHVEEPSGEHIYWMTRGKPTERGGVLDVDNLIGYGPENILWVANPFDAPDDWKAVRGPSGSYRWFVKYFDVGDINSRSNRTIPTNWKVRIKFNNEVYVYEGRLERPKDRSQIYIFEVP